MKFLVAKSRQAAMDVAKTELLWEQSHQWVLLDLYRDEVRVISKASEMRGQNVEVVYLLPSFDDIQHSQWEDFQRAFAMRNIKTQKVRL